jgi:myo-inositol-1(or 4)-monophosphatase
MNLETITGQVVNLAIDAGAFIRSERKNFNRERIERKEKNELVSYVDKETEKMLVSHLKELLPESGFVTEEQTTLQETKEYTWIIDPLDGTTNFIHGLPNYCVSIGLLKDNEVILGVIYEVANDECFYGWKDGGAFLNEEPIKVSNNTSIGDSVLATGFPGYNFEYLEQYLAIINQLMKNVHGIRRIGSAAADLAYVASGRYGGFFEHNLKPWDVAAGILLVKEAGGKVTDFKGGDDCLFGRQILAGGAVHQELLEVIEKHWYGQYK